jgi:hypothetical protein
VIDGKGLLREGGPVFQAIGVDDGAGARNGLANGADINAAALADQELGSTRPKAVALDQGPICGADVDLCGPERAPGGSPAKSTSPQHMLETVDRTWPISPNRLFGRAGKMPNLRDPRQYREDAAHFRDKAAATTDRRLRDSYLGLALQFERLAQVLDKSADREDVAAGAVEPGLPEHRPPGGPPIGALDFAG